MTPQFRARKTHVVPERLLSKVWAKRRQLPWRDTLKQGEALVLLFFVVILFGHESSRATSTYRMYNNSAILFSTVINSHAGQFFSDQVVHALIVLENMKTMFCFFTRNFAIVVTLHKFGTTKHISACVFLRCHDRFFSVEASAEELALLTKRFTVESISSLKAELRVLRAAGRNARRIKVKVSYSKRLSNDSQTNGSLKM